MLRATATKRAILSDPAPPWTTPLRAFLGKAALLPPGPLAPTWQALVGLTQRELQAAVERAEISPLPYVVPDRQDVQILLDASQSGYLRTMILLCDGCLIGGIAAGTCWIEEGARGQGLGAEMVIAAHSLAPLKFLAPTTYSRDGYGARLRAHRLSVERALAGGEAICASVLTDYETLSGGRLRLVDPDKWADGPS